MSEGIFQEPYMEDLEWVASVARLGGCLIPVYGVCPGLGVAAKGCT